MMMIKIGALIFIGLILLTAWIYDRKKNPKKKPVSSNVEEVPATASMVSKLKHDRVSGSRFRKIYPVLNERNKLRKEKHWMLVYNYRLQGILWTPFGLYWMTRELAEQHKK